MNEPPGNLQELIEQARKGYSVGMVSSFEDTFWGMEIFGAKFFDAQGFVKPELEGWAKWLEWLKQAETEPNFILRVHPSLASLNLRFVHSSKHNGVTEPEEHFLPSTELQTI